MKTRCPISYFAGKTPANPAVVHEEGVFSYGELDTRVSRTAAYLEQKGIGKGVRVAILGRNSCEFIAVLAALWRVGAVAVPLNFRFPARSLKKYFQITGATDAVLDASLVPALAGGIATLSWQEITACWNRVDRSQRPAPGIDLENEAAIILTSGSTGQAKGVLHTYANYYYNALGSNENIPLLPGERWLLSLPLFHVGGLGILFRCFLSGAAVVVSPSSASLGESISRYRVTHVSLVSTQLYHLVQERTGFSRAPLKAVLLGGSAFPAPLLRQAISLKLPVYTTYGLSEMASQVTTTPGGAAAEKLTTSGKVLKYRDLEVDEAGEICVKGKTLFKGYVEKGAISLPVDREGWFHTGDLGEIDAEGYLRVLARLDHMFISGGENIMPEEIEHVLNKFPGIQESIVVPVQDETYGYRPVAFLRFGSPGKPGKKEMLTYLQAHLPRFKIPGAFYLWPEEPGGKSLKIQRSALGKKLKGKHSYQSLW